MLIQKPTKIMGKLIDETDTPNNQEALKFDSSSDKWISDFGSTPERIDKGSDTTVNNSTTLVDASGIEYDAAANEKGFIQAYVVYESNPTADIKFGLVASGFDVAVYGVKGLANLTTADERTSNVTLSSKELLMIEIYFENGASAGTVKIQFAQITATVVNTTVYSESFLLRYPVT